MKGGAEPFSQQILDVQHARLFGEPPQPWNYTWETFQKDFKRNFISTDTKRDAYQQLRRIKQGSERIADYIHKFQRLSREAGLTDFTVLEQHFISGLNYKIHQALIPLMPVPHDTDETPMEALLKKTMSIGENIERNQSHQNDSGPRHVRHFRKRNQEYRNNYSGRFKKNHFKIRAMETDDTEEAQESDNEDIDEDPETNDEAAEEREICAQYFNHLTPDQRKTAKENNLCFYCQQRGHWAKNCPKKRARRSQRFSHNRNQYNGNRPRNSNFRRQKPKQAREMMVDGQQNFRQLDTAGKARAINAMYQALDENEYDDVVDYMENSWQINEEDHEDSDFGESGNF